jgi:hypothetical protein
MIKCPNCELIIEISNKKQTICPKCLENYGKKFIMLEENHKSYTNLGDGFFEKDSE